MLIIGPLWYGIPTVGALVPIAIFMNLGYGHLLLTPFFLNYLFDLLQAFFVKMLISQQQRSFFGF